MLTCPHPAVGPLHDAFLMGVGVLSHPHPLNLMWGGIQVLFSLNKYLWVAC